MSTYIVIPVRLASTRFPNKALHKVDGVPLVQHLFTELNKLGHPVSVACARKDVRTLLNETDLVDIIPTADNCNNGTERVADAAKQLKANNDDLFVNVQCDQFLIDTSIIKRAIDYFNVADKKDVISNVKCLSLMCEEPVTHRSINTVKVVTNVHNEALYFSRNIIPVTKERKAPLKQKTHIGIYLYSYLMLDWYIHSLRTPNERIEDLEQLRFLEQGMTISMMPIERKQKPISINYIEDTEII